MNETRTGIVIIGAGYGGMMATLRLAGRTRRMPVEITLVNSLPNFVERLRLHEWATSQPATNVPITRMLRGTRVNFLQGNVVAIEARQQVITVQSLSGEQHLDYDFLIYALGSATDQDSVPGIRDNAYVLNAYGARSAESLRGILPTLMDMSGRIVVCGGGPTGIEAAAQIKGKYPTLDVWLVTAGECGAFIKKPVQDYIRASLTRQGIRLHERAIIEEVMAHEVRLADGTSMPFDLCVWAGGFKGSPLAFDSGISTTSEGRIQVDPFLRSISFPNIYVVGDAAYPVEADGSPAHIGAPARMSAFFALVTGAHVADNLTRLIRNKQPKPLGFSTWGQAIALGPRNAVGFATFPNDWPVGPIYRGEFAFHIRAFFVWFLRFSLDLERRWPGFFFWLGKGRYRDVGAVPALKKRVQQVG